jgi:transcriptional regulator with XRE-family HTH domain
MSPRSDPPAALMAFAEELRAHRALAGMSRDDLAAKVSYSSSLIAMIETGRRSPSRKLAELLDVVFSLPGTFARLEKRLRDVPFPHRSALLFHTRPRRLRCVGMSTPWCLGCSRPRTMPERCYLLDPTPATIR